MISRINIKKIGGFIQVLFLIVLLSVPFLTYSVEDPEMEGKTGITYYCLDGNCNFEDLLEAVKRVVDFAVGFTLFFSVVVIAYAGFKYMTSGDNASKRTEANKMLLSVAKGIVFILAAWLIVSLILRALQVDSPIQF